MTDIMVLDSRGRLVESTELHHGQGSVVLQALSVESDRVHYVVVTPSELPESQVGEFEIVMDYGPELRSSREIGQITLDRETTVLDQPFSVSSPRLVHIHLDSRGDGQHANDRPRFAFRIRTTTLGSNRTAFGNFTFRTAYILAHRRLHIAIHGRMANQGAIRSEAQVNIFIDEVSIDVGPGVADPTGTPFLPCSDPEADPTSAMMNSYRSIVNAPIIPEPIAGTGRIGLPMVVGLRIQL